MEISTIPNLPSFRNMVPDAISFHNSSSNKLVNAKQNARKNRAKTEEELIDEQIMEIQ